MSANGMETKSAESENKLEVVGYDDKDQSFVVKSSSTERNLKILDPFAEMLTLMETYPKLLLYLA